ncbi:unnamed protein product, partial [Oppiella nova]
MNGQTVSQPTIASISSYIQQHDLFQPMFTVREHLLFHALLRMDSNLSRNERIDCIQRVIEKFNLAKCAETRIGDNKQLKGISGGEMKRLSFASEVLTNPSLMFCDEPTTGLDSFMAKSIVQVLKTMASEGRTVICTIHQPSSPVFQLFDSLLLMADGRFNLAKCAETRIGDNKQLKGISGGEMKRLSFASEVLTNPSLMFCDEPTTGLDSFMAKSIVQVLKTMASEGRTVICTIH